MYLISWGLHEIFVGKNTMTFRRITGKGEEEIILEDPNFDRNLDLITEGGRPFVKEHLPTKISRINCTIIINYILAMQTK